MKRDLRNLSLAGCLILMILCGSVSAKQARKAAPTKITMLCSYYGINVPSNNLEVYKKLDEYTHTQLNVTWVPFNAYNEKYNALLASGDLPEIVLCYEPKKPTMLNAIRAGMFWEIGPYIKNYKNLKQLNKSVFDSLTVDGKTYGLFRQRILARHGYAIRKDWLDRLKLKMPETMEDVYKVAEAFTKNDPDGNGKNDTIGLAESSNAQIRPISVWYGGQTNWYLDHGKLLPEFMGDAYLKALDLYRRLYSHGYINKDFPLVKQRFDNINNGKAGICFCSIDDAVVKTNDLYKINPQARLDVFMPLKTPQGKRVVRTTSGCNGIFYFPKTNIKTPVELKARLAFMDKLGDPVICDLINWGIKDVDYSITNGGVSRTSEQITKYTNFLSDNLQITPFWKLKQHLTEVNTSPLALKIDNYFNKCAKIIVPDIGAQYQSETYLKFGGELDKIWQDAQIKYILGQIDLAGWKSAIEQWKSSGGNKVIDEYTQQYNQSKKN
jgi:putative aldouronate transport system substrate-binding protein